MSQAVENKKARLGFGLMRLPQRGDNIDVERLKTMTDDFLDAGFTYFDTAYAYYGGDSERAIRKALVERHPRDSFTIADKIPAWQLNAPGDPERIFSEMLENLGTDYIDYLLLHSMERAYRETYDKFGCWDYAAKLKAAGKIRFFGFSFHDTPQLLDELLSEHPEVDFVQLQVNYADWSCETVHSAANLEAARRHEKPVVVMEPVKGGLLTALDGDMRAVLESNGENGSNAAWALRFAASQAGVKMVLSGMSDEEQMRENISTMRNFRPLDAAETALVLRVGKLLSEIPTVPCTNCCYCLRGCPMSIAIPKFMTVLNNYLRYGRTPAIVRDYGVWSARKNSPAACVECKQCESICPQHIEITVKLKQLVEIMG